MCISTLHVRWSYTTTNPVHFEHYGVDKIKFVFTWSYTTTNPVHFEHYGVDKIKFVFTWCCLNYHWPTQTIDFHTKGVLDFETEAKILAALVHHLFGTEGTEH